MPGKRDERRCDKIIRLDPSSELADRVRRAEKFTFDAAATTRICVTSSTRRHPSSTPPDLAILPCRNCWFEWHMTTKADPTLSLHQGFLLQADEAFQRGTIWHIGTGLEGDGDIRVPDYQIGFDFTRDFDDRSLAPAFLATTGRTQGPSLVNLLKTTTTPDRGAVGGAMPIQRFLTRNFAC
jgi:hypothetical protein